MAAPQTSESISSGVCNSSIEKQKAKDLGQRGGKAQFALAFIGFLALTKRNAVGQVLLQKMASPDSCFVGSASAKKKKKEERLKQWQPCACAEGQE